LRAACLAAPSELPMATQLRLTFILVLALSVRGRAQAPSLPANSLKATLAALERTGGIADLPCGIYEVDTAESIAITRTGVGIQGSGYCTRIRIHGTGDLFRVSGELFRLENLEIEVATNADRRTAAVRADANQGHVANLRITGNPRSPNNGTAFALESDRADLWHFDHVRIPGGARWTSIWRMALTSGTVASTRISNSVAVFDIDGAVDTLEIVNSDFPSQGGSIFWIHNSVGAGISPRWIHCVNCYVEAPSAVAIRLDAVRDFRYQGYIATALTAVQIGQNASQVGIISTEIVNIGESAITIAPGAIDTTIAFNSFEDIGVARNDTFDCIKVAADASHWRVRDNSLRASGRKKPRFGLFVAPGRSTDYEYSGNSFPFRETRSGGISDKGMIRSGSALGMVHMEPRIDIVRDDGQDDRAPVLSIDGKGALSLNGDTPFSAAPRLVWSAFTQTLGTSAYGAMVVERPITVTRVLGTVQTSPTGCTVFPAIQLVDESKANTLATVALSAGGAFDSGPLAVHVDAGTRLELRTARSGTGCSTPVAGTGITVQYRMQ
jgi:hypothetical protein